MDWFHPAPFTLVFWESSVYIGLPLQAHSFWCRQIKRSMWIQTNVKWYLLAFVIISIKLYSIHPPTSIDVNRCVLWFKKKSSTISKKIVVLLAGEPLSRQHNLDRKFDFKSEWVPAIFFLDICIIFFPFAFSAAYNKKNSIHFCTEFDLIQQVELMHSFFFLFDSLIFDTNL